MFTFYVLAIVMFACDIAMKFLAFKYVAGQPVTDVNMIPPHEPVSLVPSVLSLKLTTNHGAVFGMGQGGRVVFIGVTLLAIAAIVTMFWRSGRSQRVLHIGMSLILAGALGNLFDRALYGGVRDMLYLFPGVQLPFGWSWPSGIREVYPWIFNIADVALVIGVCLLFLTMMRPRPRPRNDGPGVGGEPRRVEQNRR